MDHGWTPPETYRVERDLAGAFGSLLICAAITAAVVVTALHVHAHGIGNAAAFAGVLACAGVSAIGCLLEAINDCRGFAYPVSEDDEQVEEPW